MLKFLGLSEKEIMRFLEENLMKIQLIGFCQKDLNRKRIFISKVLE